jgi:predicted O-linked N-acetylglucosamine transferase (SPINDLY family)
LKVHCPTWPGAVQLDPGLSDVHYNLGKAYQELGRLDEAAVCYRRTLDLQPGYRKALLNLAVVLKNLGQTELAIALCQRLLKLDAGDHNARIVMGNAYMETGQLESAVGCYRNVLEDQSSPYLPEALNNLGIALTGLGLHVDAIACYQQALQIKPEFFEAQSNLLYARNLIAEQPVEEMLEDARHFGQLVAARAQPYSNWKVQPLADKRLRIGLVTGDLRNHPVGYFLETVLAALDPHAVELFAYVTHAHDDDLTERVKPFFAGWVRGIGSGDAALAQRIHADAIDILIDLAGHTAGTRLAMFAWKPAPVQVSWLGYFATTGVAAMDYLLADPQVAPVDEAAHFSETVWRLPEIYYCFTPPDVPLDVAPTPALSNGYITFGCFNKLAKMNDGVVQVWSQVLHALPEAKLMLKAKELGDAAQRALVLERFARHGILPERLIMAGKSPRAEYLAAYHQVDIALDPFPYTGGTTTVEGLWMGVPALTLKGDRFIGHQGETILRNAGLPDWIARDTDDYVAMAVAFAGDLAALSDLRAGLRGQLLASPVCDAPRFARHFEAALRGMWRQWCDTAPGS